MNSEALDVLAGRIAKRTQEDNDAIVAISGYQGSGKSTLGIQLAKRICAIFGKSFSIKDDIIWEGTPSQIYDKVFHKEVGGVLVIDEALKIANRRYWWSAESRFLENLLNCARKRRLCIIFALPRFVDLIEPIRNQRCYLWLDVVARGVAVLKKRLDAQANRDPWLLTRSEGEIREAGSKYVFASTFQKLKFETRQSNFVCVVEFDDLDAATKQEYRDLAEASDKDYLQKLLVKDEESKKKSTTVLAKKYRRALAYTVGIIAKAKIMTLTDLAKGAGLHRHTIDELLGDYDKLRGADTSETV